MPNFIKIFDNTDVSLINQQLADNPTLWHPDTFIRDYEQGPIGDVESVILRFSKYSGAQQTRMKTAGIYFDIHENIDYNAYSVLNAVYPLVMQLMQFAGGTRLGRIVINKIKPGGRIYEHRDELTHANYYSRFHIVLKSKEGNRFICGDEEVHMQEGTIWWFDNTEVHEVINESTEDRIHVIVDIKSDIFDKIKIDNQNNAGRIVQETKKVSKINPDDVYYQVETIDGFIDEFKETMVQMHYDELALDHSAVPLDPDYNKYYELENQGKLIIVTARIEGKLIGYFIAVIAGNIHYKSTLHANEDIYYLDPQYRGSLIGLGLFQYVETELKKLGVVKVVVGTKCHLDNSKLLNSLGYNFVEKIFTKIIGD